MPRMEPEQVVLIVELALRRAADRMVRAFETDGTGYDTGLHKALKDVADDIGKELENFRQLHAGQPPTYVVPAHPKQPT